MLPLQRIANLHMAKAGSVVGNRRARVLRENIIDAIDGTGAAIAVMWGRRCTAAPARCVLRKRDG
jgi:hypothetical protein